MKKLLKVLLPPLMGFVVFFALVRFNTTFFALSVEQMGEGTVAVFVDFYKYILSLLFLVALLTQLLIVNPIWRSVAVKKLYSKLLAVLCLILVCSLFSAGITYLITDNTDPWHHKFMLFWFMTLVQLSYWLINLGTLFLLE